MSARKNVLKCLGFACFSAASALIWSLYETKHPKIREYSLPVLPENTKPVRVLHISDLHFRGEKSAWMTKWLSELDLSNIDFVISTGDNLGANGVNSEVVEALSNLLKLPGAFIFGSNDYFGPKKKNPLKYFFTKAPIDKSKHIKGEVLDSEGLRQSFVSAGWLDLNNKTAVVDLPQCKVELVGVDDPHIGKAVFPEKVFFEKDSKTVRLGLAHAPYIGVIAELAHRNCDVSFYGHTHGGQLAVPLFGALVSNCDLPAVFASGVYSTKTIFEYVKAVLGSYNDKVALNCECDESLDDLCEKESFVSITAGLGVAPMIPFRFGCPPEISIITLEPKNS